MATKITVLNTEYLAKLKNGDTFILNPSDVATFLLGGMTEEMRFKATVHLQNKIKLSPLEIQGTVITSTSSQNFLNEDLYVGGTVIYSSDEEPNLNWRFDIVSISADGSQITAANVVQVDDAGSDIGTGVLPQGPRSSEFEHTIRDLSPSEGLRLKFGFVGNNDTPTFASPLDGIEQAFKFDGIRTAAPTPVTGVWDSNIKGSKTGDCTIQFINDISDGGVVKTGGVGRCPQDSIQEFEIIQDFIYGPFFIQGETFNIQNLLRPDRILGQNLRHVIDFEFRSTLSNPNDTKLGVYDSVMGNTNYFNENYIDQPQKFSIQSFQIQDVTNGGFLDSLEVNTVNRVTFSVISSPGVFLTNDPVIVSHTYLPTSDIYEGQLNEFKDVWLFDSVRGVVDAAPSSGTIITDVDIDLVSVNQIDITYDITFNSSQQALLSEGYDYLLTCVVGDSTLSTELSDKTPLVAQQSQYTQNSDVPGLVTFNQSRFLFFCNQLSDVDKFSELKGWIQDDILYEWNFDLERDTLGAVLQSLTVRLVAIKSDNTFFELDSVAYDLSDQVIVPGPPSTQQITVDTTRGFPMADGDIFNLVQMETNAYSSPNQNYTGRTAFQVPWQKWQELLSVDPVFYDITEPNNGLNKQSDRFSGEQGYELKILMDLEVSQDIDGVDQNHTTRYIDKSVEMTIFNYGEQDNSPVIWTAVKKTFDSLGNDTNGQILKGESTTLEATFTPNIAFGPDPVDYCAEVKIEELNNPGQGVFILRSYGDTSVLTPLRGPGGTSNVEITAVSGDIIVKAETIPELLDPAKSYNVTWRLSLLDGNVPSIPTSFMRISLNIKDNNNIGPDLRRIAVFQQTEQMFNTSIESEYFDFDNASLIYRFNTVDPGINGWDAITPVSFAVWANLLQINSNGFACIETTDTGFTDGGLEVRYDRLIASTVPQTATLEFPDNTFDLDSIIWLDKKITNMTFSNVSNLDFLGFGLRTANPSTEDWTDFSIPDFPTLQANIDALTEGDKYGVHIAYQKNVKALGSMDFNFEYDDQQSVMFNLVESNNNVGFYRNWGNGITWNKGVEYGRINNDLGLNQLFNIANSQPFTISFEVEINGGAGVQDLMAPSVLNGMFIRLVRAAVTQVRFGFFNGTFMFADFGFRLQGDEKYMMTFTWDGSDENGFECYVNGIKLVATTRFNNGPPATSVPPDGFYYHGASLGDGFMATDSFNKTHNIPIWDRVLSPLEIRRMFNDLEYPAANLFRRYECGQGATATIVDTSPSATTNFENIDFATVLPVIPVRNSFI